MRFADCFTKGDGTRITFSDLTALIREGVTGELLMNVVNCNVPHRYIREMATGRSEEPVKELLAEPDVSENIEEK